MKFGDRLKEVREAAGMTQQGLAVAAGLSIGGLRNYEQGIRLPTFAAVVRLAAALGTDCTAFAACEDVKNGDPPAAKPPTGKAGTANTRGKGKRPG